MNYFNNKSILITKFEMTGWLPKTLGGLRDAPRFLFPGLGASSRPPSV